VEPTDQDGKYEPAPDEPNEPNGPDESSEPTPRDEMLKRLTRRLLDQGLLREEGGKEVRYPIVIGTNEEPWFALGGRILVDERDAAKAREALGDSLADVTHEKRLGVAELVLRDRSGEALERAIQLLAERGITATPHHLLFTAWRGRVYEGEDPEQADRPEGPPPPPLPGRNVRVAVVDNGVAKEALDDRWLQGIEVDERDYDPLRVYEPRKSPPTTYLDVGAGHGTFVIGVLRQMAPGCEVSVIRALDSDGIGTELEVARGILRAVDSRAHIINLSIGGPSASNRPPTLIERAMNQISQDTIVVAAAGNESSDRPVWPGAIRRVVSVAATVAAGDDDEATVTPELESWSNWGWWVDVAAPATWSSVYVKGEENPIIETDLEPEVFEKPFARAAGSSFAAAAVSGALASEMRPGELSARPALRRLLSRRRNVPLPWGGISLDIWDD
jgi:hypothetical protein